MKEVILVEDILNDYSNWLNKKGYIDFFREQVIKEVQDQLLNSGHGGGNWRRLIIQLK